MGDELDRSGAGGSVKLLVAPGSLPSRAGRRARPRPTAPGVWFVFLLGPLLVLPSAQAQGSRADYERAARLQQAARGQVTDLGLQHVWRSPSELIVRIRGQLYRVDCTSGERTRASAQDAETELAPARGRRSRDDGGETEIVFENRTEAPLELVWLDRQGQPKSYGSLAPGQRRAQHTFAGHLWSIRQGQRELLRVRGQLWPGTARVDAQALERRAKEPQAERPPRARPSRPSGPRVVTREHDLYLRQADGGLRRLTEDGQPGDFYRAPLRSPDGRYVAALQRLPAQQHTVSLVRSSPRQQVQPRLEQFDYLKPGDRIASDRVRIVRVKDGQVASVPADALPHPWSLTRLRWRDQADSGADSGEGSGQELTLLYNARGHQRLSLVGVDPETGAVRTIVEETSRTFVDYPHKTYLRWLKGGRELVWMSERTGQSHLYRYDADAGALLNPVTEGDWLVRGVEQVDERAGTVTFRALGVFPDQDPYHVHYGRVGLDGQGLVWLTRGDGTHQLSWGPGREYYVDTWSRVDQPPVHELRRASDGALVCELTRADWEPLLATGWRPPQRFVAPGRDGHTPIWGIIHFPSQAEPNQKFPVVEQIYAGPHGHHVPKRFSPWHGAQDLAELGFVVVQIDGMGTNWRGKAFHDVAWKNLGDGGFPDRIRWIKAAARAHSALDLSRGVGIYGGSAGGQNALRALLVHGDFYTVGVADCGCHDNRMDKIWWNELWMGWDGHENPEQPLGPHYAEQSNVTQAHRLTGELLLIVGEMDKNVDPASTLQVVDALIRADKDFELLLMPNVGHGAAGTPYGRRRLLDFFVRKLWGTVPRAE